MSAILKALRANGGRFKGLHGGPSRAIMFCLYRTNEGGLIVAPVYPYRNHRLVALRVKDGVVVADRELPCRLRCEDFGGAEVAITRANVTAMKIAAFATTARQDRGFIIGVTKVR